VGAGAAAVGIVTLARFGAGVEVHPLNAVMHRIAVAKTPCGDGDP
jgi:hypothetical protein